MKKKTKNCPDNRSVMAMSLISHRDVIIGHSEVITGDQKKIGVIYKKNQGQKNGRNKNK